MIISISRENPKHETVDINPITFILVRFLQKRGVICRVILCENESSPPHT